MVAPLWTSVGPGDTIGAASVAAGLWTVTGHGLPDGAPVMVGDISGLDIVTTYGVYHLRDVDDDDFRLSATPGGPPLEVGSGTADLLDIQGLSDGAALRRADSVLMWGGHADRLGARSGVRPVPTPVEVAGTTWTVRDLPAVIYPRLTSLSGPYRVAIPETSGSIDPADGSNPRRDILVARVYDDSEDSSGDRVAVVEYIAGTPGSSPQLPSVPQGALRVATLHVPASGQGSPTVLAGPQWQVASGGILPVEDESDLPSDGVTDGAAVWVRGDRSLRVGNPAGGFDVVASPATDWQYLGDLELDGSGQLVADPIDPDWLELYVDAPVLKATGDVGGAGVAVVRCRVNGFSGEDTYRYQVREQEGGTLTPSTVAQTYHQWGFAPDSDSSSNFFGAGWLHFRQHVNRVMVESECWAQPGAVHANWRWRSTTARYSNANQFPVERIALFVSGQQFTSLSRASLYGRGRR